ncbi:MAG: DUF3253 domain-containing protein [Phenylobacterium sp.]|uniref:DUF3253 domain-containing protein n=1 Tax=Phenylobacterium sp. TaxID=1871053 RepID=UPI0027287269|nr:DUF3253 domain-containing protein [Phenylobacterium sp.]MDO8900355.1 DUF3253 domain-containing protein [Phenylobacterium sp.]MDP2213017.1 DUF3253 domain-containing protein [Phenylobacterium sp.]
MSDPIETAIFELLTPLAPGKSISAEQAARAADPEGWHRWLSRVRTVSVGLAREGRLVITRHGKPADPNQFKGVYRLRLPLEGEVLPGVLVAPSEPPATE